MQMIRGSRTFRVGVTATWHRAAECGKGKRFALPMLRAVSSGSSGMQGYTEDVRRAFREQERLQTQLFILVGQSTGRDWREVEGDFERDRYMDALEAKEYGLVDQVLGDTDHIVSVRDGTIHVPSQDRSESE